MQAFVAFSIGLLAIPALFTDNKALHVLWATYSMFALSALFI